jgi:hypothetical protein
MPPVFKLGRRILLLALLLVMPIQGIAAPVSHLLCPSSSAAEPLDMGSEHDHEGSSSNDGNNTPAGHLSCHQVSSGIPSITVLTFAGDLPVYHPSSLTSPSLFIPEQPQRPPRA